MAKAKTSRSNRLAGKVRIIGGRWRSRQLTVADVPGLRPTPDRVRETLFNWLTPIIEGANCLDLFAGTGVLGLEALSRGAANATMVDNARLATQTLQIQSENLNAGDQVILVQQHARAFLEQNQEQFDLVFLDPPFADDINEWCGLLANSGCLAPRAYVYVEHQRHKTLSPPANWQPYRQGNTAEVGFQLLQVESQSDH